MLHQPHPLLVGLHVLKMYCKSKRLNLDCTKILATVTGVAYAHIMCGSCFQVPTQQPMNAPVFKVVCAGNGLRRKQYVRLLMLPCLPDGKTCAH